MENSVGKNKPVNERWLQEGIKFASTLVVSPSFIQTYKIAEIYATKDDVKNLTSVISQVGSAIGNEDLMAADLDIRRNMQSVGEELQITPERWAESFQSVARKRKAIELFERAINLAQPLLAKSPTELRDTLPDKPDFPSECSAAYRRTREHLLANPQSTRWLGLLLFTLARAIGTNSRSAYASNTWDDSTFFWLQLEQVWLQANGALVGKMLLDADDKFFAHRIAMNLASSMPTRLAESASIAPEWSLFHPPW